MKFLCMEGNPLYLTICCGIIALVGLLDFFFGGLIIGIIEGFLMIALAITGVIGAWFKSAKVLLYFMLGCAILIVIALISLILNITDKTNYFTIVLDILSILFYGCSIFLAFFIRNNKGWFTMPNTTAV